jgi:secreted protein with Ig-like and vWFA domain
MQRFTWLLVTVAGIAACGAPPAPPRAAVPIVAAPSASPPDSEPSAEAPPDAAPASDQRLALALVVDRSGSMTGLPLEMTKEALKSAVRALDRDDWVTIVIFDSAPVTLVEPRPMETGDALDAQIQRIQAGGGTDVLPALEHAGQSLTKEGVPARRHVILMSDGQAPENELESIVGKLAQGGTTISTVALGADAGRELLERIAGLGRGRFHRVDDPRSLPDVFREEVARARAAER